jgi:hypothetical protein
MPASSSRQLALMKAHLSCARCTWSHYNSNRVRYLLIQLFCGEYHTSGCSKVVICRLDSVAPSPWVRRPVLNSKLKAAIVINIMMIKKKGLDEYLGLCRVVVAVEEVMWATAMIPKPFTDSVHSSELWWSKRSVERQSKRNTCLVMDDRLSCGKDP